MVRCQSPDDRDPERVRRSVSRWDLQSVAGQANPSGRRSIARAMALGAIAVVPLAFASVVLIHTQIDRASYAAGYEHGITTNAPPPLHDGPAPAVEKRTCLERLELALRSGAEYPGGFLLAHHVNHIDFMQGCLDGLRERSP